MINFRIFGSCTSATALTVSAFLLTIFSFAARAQSSGKAAAPSSVVVGTTVDEVNLDLVVHDKSGKDVPDLKPEELEIIDGNSPVRITSLRRLNSAPGSERAQNVMLLFDDLEPGNAKTARDAALSILKATRESEITFSVLRVDLRLRLLQAPTTDRDALEKAVTLATIADRTACYAAITAAENAMTEDTRGGPRQSSAKMLLAILLDSQKLAEDPHTTTAVAGLLAVARGEQTAPGRKTVLYFSQSLNWNVSAPEGLRAIVDAANRAHVAIYSLDAHVIDPGSASGMIASAAMSNAGSLSVTGVTKPSSAGPAGSPSAAGGGIGNTITEQMGRFEQGDTGLEKNPLRGICQRTGGSHENAGDKKGARRIADDLLASYYVASFTPAAGGDDGRFRAVRVRALRAGASIQARAGYFALPHRGASVAPAFEGTLLSALAAPKLASDVPLRAAVLRFGKSANGDENALVVQVPLSGVELRAGAAGNTYTAHVAILAQVKDKAGAVIARFTEDFPREGRIDPLQKAPTDAFVLRRHFTAAPGSYVVETAVIDVNGGKAGAQRTDLVLPPAPSGAFLGDIVPVHSIVPFADDADIENDREDPLRCVDGRVIPNLSGHYSKAADPRITLFFDIHPDVAVADPPVVTVEVRRDGSLLGTVPLRITQDVRKTIPYLAQLGTATLPAGDYRLTMILKQGTQTYSGNVTFTLDQ